MVNEMDRMKYLVPVLLCVFYGTDGQDVDPLVQTNAGLIRGVRAPTGNYSMFLGIRYARVNESNPFGVSIPILQFEGTFNAVDDSAVCPQISEYNHMPYGTLDCLHLSVHVPDSASSSNRLPVMVFIHGGGYITGAGNRFYYDPIHLVRHDVIAVTLNYRLGAYSWMCLDTPEVPGNQGLKDQLTALRWIKNNIEAFGGDSDKITIFGESAGAVSVDLHLHFNQEDLFSSAIIQSGTALSLFAIAPNDPGVPVRLARHLGHETDDMNDALEFLRTVDTNAIAVATVEIDFTIRPCVEREFENVERYVTRHPDGADIPSARTKPIMIGFNDNEFGVNYDVSDDVDEWDPFTLLSSTINSSTTHYRQMVRYARSFYIGDEDNIDNVEDEVADFRADVVYAHPTHRSIFKYLDNGGIAVYNYLFAYNGERNAMIVRLNGTGTISGALHTDELGYLFDMYLFDGPPTPEDQLIIDRMTTMWTNFAKYSNPTPEITDILPVQWLPVTAEFKHCLKINTNVTLELAPFHDRITFFDVFYELDEVLSAATTNNGRKQTIFDHSIIFICCIFYMIFKL